MLELLLLLVGFFPLILGAQWLVEGGSSLAKSLNVPSLVIGLTIVAFGTSTPELIVNLFSATRGSTDLALGNVTGSNIFNVLGILGISALIVPLTVKKTTAWLEIPLTFLSALILLIMASDAFLDGSVLSVLSRIDGSVFLAFFSIFLVYNFQLAKTGGDTDVAQIKERKTALSVGMIVLGLGALVLGGKLIVDNAAQLARLAGISERVIGLTIVAIGTSLPELATSLVAAIKKQPDIAIGNIVGSNIFNIFFILGVTAIIAPVPASPAFQVDMVINLGVSALLFLFVFTGKGRQLGRWEGAILLASYVGYLVFLILSP